MPPARRSRRSRAREALSTTFRNRYFLLFLPAFALFQLGFQLLLGVLRSSSRPRSRSTRSGGGGAILTTVALGTMLLTISLMTRLSRRTSKRRAYRASLLAAIALFPLLRVRGLPPRDPAEAQLVIAMVLVGLPIAGSYLFRPADGGHHRLRHPRDRPAPRGDVLRRPELRREDDVGLSRRSSSASCSPSGRRPRITRDPPQAWSPRCSCSSATSCSGATTSPTTCSTTTATQASASRSAAAT